MQAWRLQTGIFLWRPYVLLLIPSEHPHPSFPDWMVDSSWGLLDKGVLAKSTLPLVSCKLQWNVDWKIKWFPPFHFLGSSTVFPLRKEAQKAGKKPFSGTMTLLALWLRSALDRNVPGRLAVTGWVLVPPNKPNWEVSSLSHHHKWRARKYGLSFSHQSWSLAWLLGITDLGANKTFYYTL